MFRDLQAAGVDRGRQDLDDRCARISEQLDQRNLPWVVGWKPPGFVKRTSTPASSQEQIWRLLEPRVAALSDELGMPTSDRDTLERRSALLSGLGQRGMAPRGTRYPTTSDQTQRYFVRDPKVVRWVRDRAAGVCELCTRPAPFQTDGGSPFLEVHHVVHLANGGSDTPANTVALCPNCHRRCHHAIDRSIATADLYRQVRGLLPE
jgi:5-methylcytosine-specific restriction protein A